MKSRMSPNLVVSAILIVALLLPLSGCPLGPSFALGVWLFSIEPVTGYVGAAFLPNGEMDEFDAMNRPTGADGNFSGVLTWQQVGNNLTVSQDNNGAGRIYAGTLENTTYMTGTWTNINDASDTGSFTASKAPSN